MSPDMEEVNRMIREEQMQRMYSDIPNFGRKSRKPKKQTLKSLIYVGWEESERGWGTRPDGCSLHLSAEDYQTFFKEYAAKQPRYVPDEYSRPAGEPIPVKVTPEVYQRVEKSKNGIFVFQNELAELRKKKKLIYGTERSGWMPLRR